MKIILNQAIESLGSEGEILDDSLIECPWHGACFEITTGKLQEGPGEENIRSYPVYEKGDSFFIEI